MRCKVLKSFKDNEEYKEVLRVGEVVEINNDRAEKLLALTLVEETDDPLLRLGVKPLSQAQKEPEQPETGEPEQPETGTHKKGKSK